MIEAELRRPAFDATAHQPNLGALPGMTDTSSEFVTIVSGLPRSGTSMAMRMIDEGECPP